MRANDTLRNLVLARWPEVSPGLHGSVRTFTDSDQQLVTVVAVLAAVDPMKGAGGAFLDQLLADHRVVVLNVASPVLAGMLRRRGFAMSRWHDSYQWVREPVS